MTDRKIRVSRISPKRDVVEFLRSRVGRLDLDPIEEDAVIRFLDEVERRIHLSKISGEVPPW